MDLDDLQKKLGELLSSPDAMQKLQSAIGSLGLLSDDSKSDESPLPAAQPVPSKSSPLNGLESLLSGGDGGSADMLLKLMPLLSGLQDNDQDTVLLRSLRPYLHDERQGKLDETVKMLRLLRMLPLLRQGGLGL